MDWVLEHLQVLFLIAVAVVAILQKLKTPGSTGAGRAPPGMDPEQAERTRRIQEEIRRRIMERRGLTPAAAPEPELAEEEPAPFPEAPPMIEEVRPIVVPPPPDLPEEELVAAEEPMSESSRQEQVLRQFRELQAAHAAGRDSVSTEQNSDSSRQEQVVLQFRELQAAQAAGRVSAPVRRSVNLQSLDLRNPASLRRAVVLREILGPPVGMR